MRALVGSSVLLASLLASTAAAHGDTDGFSTLMLEPVLDGDGAIGVVGARTLGQDSFSTGLSFSWVDSPLVLLPAQGTDEDELEMIERQMILDYVVAVAFGRRLQVGAGIPLVLDQQGDFADIGDGPSTSALGDARVELKWAIIPNDPDGPGLALAPQVILPSGDQDSFVGEEGIAFHPRVVADFRIGVIEAFANLGAKIRTVAGRLEELDEYSHELTWGAALGVPVPGLRDQGTLLVEYRGATQLAEPFGVAGANPAELDGAFRVLLPSIDLTFVAGGGVGLTESVGTPSFRAFGGVSWRPTEHDEDGDGIPDSDDDCDPIPEDVDGFQDEDGCPELDNDRDGIDDADDRCPNEPEDVDHVEDEDGCPDPDADNDGVLDDDDRCPGEQEDQDAFEDEDGCPDPDNDGDGRPDVEDRCPNEAEDEDGFQDEDGCPDPNNDADEIADADDRCPNEPEDRDGFQDEDGCPDIDNDRDGVLDANDTCPDGAESINGVRDGDGCPDAGGVTHVRLVDGNLRIAGQLAFSAQNEPIPATRQVLSQLAMVLIQNHPIAVRIVSRGPSAETGAARAEAVRRYLVEKGVPEASAGTVSHEQAEGATRVVVTTQAPEAPTPAPEAPAPAPPTE